MRLFGVCVATAIAAWFPSPVPAQESPAAHVNVSGKILDKKVEEGVFKVFWHTGATAPLWPPQDAVDVGQDMRFSLSVPANQGQVYVTAMYVPHGGTCDASVTTGPFEIGELNVFGVNMKVFPDVKVSGTVSHDSFGEGSFLIFWHDASSTQMPPKAAGATVTLDRPGKYSLPIPANQGMVYIRAMHFKSNGLLEEGAQFGPLKIARSDFNGVDIKFSGTSKPFMERGFSGPVVRISGKALREGWGPGVVRVTAQTARNYRLGNVPPDIARLTLNGPGDYVIEVPRGAGEIYLTAFFIPSRDPDAGVNTPGTVRVLYAGNPVIVGDSDILNIDF